MRGRLPLELGHSLERRTAMNRSNILIALAAGAFALSATAADPTLENYKTAEKLANAHLVKFDTLDFDVFSNQKWDRLKESHAADVTVTWPDGHETHGIDRHIEDLKAMFVAVPDTRITAHPIKIANGHWTAVVGNMQGTFSRPMKTPDGKTIPPTGKKLNMQMVTVGHW